MIALRDRPPPFGPGRIGKYTLVAITTSSRFAKSLSARPSTVSLSPCEYMFATSKKVMPSSSARWMKGRLSASSRCQVRLFTA